jgi:hypothetical protein
LDYQNVQNVQKSAGFERQTVKDELALSRQARKTFLNRKRLKDL